jgi:hypothetical protein
LLPYSERGIIFTDASSTNGGPGMADGEGDARRPVHIKSVTHAQTSFTDGQSPWAFSRGRRIVGFVRAIDRAGREAHAVGEDGDRGGWLALRQALRVERLLNGGAPCSRQSSL